MDGSHDVEKGFLEARDEQLGARWGSYVNIDSKNSCVNLERVKQSPQMK
jgi:hypothetical protein